MLPVTLAMPNDNGSSESEHPYLVLTLWRRAVCLLELSMMLAVGLCVCVFLIDALYQAEKVPFSF